MRDHLRQEVHDAVQERYAAAARPHLQLLTGPGATGGCCASDGCCGGGSTATRGDANPITRDLYDPDTPFAAALAASLGCGNPTVLADLNPGEVVLDLGSGGGLDVLLSARRVAPGGHAFGLDMTEEMLDLARRNQAAAGVTNATFLSGQIEQVPLSSASVDVVISNCVINLSPDKPAVLAEAFRVLKPGGRFAVSDVVLLRSIPDALRGIVELWTGCVSGALVDEEYLRQLAAVGFVGASVEVTRMFGSGEINALVGRLDPTDLPPGMVRAEVASELDGAFASAFIRATKPR